LKFDWKETSLSSFPFVDSLPAIPCGKGRSKGFADRMQSSCRDINWRRSLATSNRERTFIFGLRQGNGILANPAYMKNNPTHQINHSATAGRGSFSSHCWSSALLCRSARALLPHGPGRGCPATALPLRDKSASIASPPASAIRPWVQMRSL
jgi:hypothetical protein